MVNNTTFKKLCLALAEPDDMTIWRYSAGREMSDSAWRRYVRNHNVAEKIAHAKGDGSWDDHCHTFLKHLAEGGVPLTAFLSDEGRKWLDDIVRLSEGNGTR